MCFIPTQVVAGCHKEFI